MEKIDKENKTIFVLIALVSLPSKYEPNRGYCDEFKRECLKMYVNGSGSRAIERVLGVHHTTVITWIKQVGELLPDAYNSETTPQVVQLDELETFIGKKKQSQAGDSSRSFQTRDFRMGSWRPALRRSEAARSGKTFQVLWEQAGKWQCYFYITDGWKVYPNFIPDVPQIGKQNLHDPSRRREYKIETLSGSTTSQNFVLFKI